MELVSPALEGGFSTTGPPGKSLYCFVFNVWSSGLPRIEFDVSDEVGVEVHCFPCVNHASAAPFQNSPSVLNLGPVCE